jgi:hypothetical protein
VIGEYVYDGEGGRHQAFYSPVKDVHFKDIHFKAGERIQVEQSLKYSAEETAQLWRASGLNEVSRWSASSEAYSTSQLLVLVSFLAQNYVTGSHTNMRLFPLIHEGQIRSHDHLLKRMWGCAVKRVGDAQASYQTLEEQGRRPSC